MPKNSNPYSCPSCSRSFKTIKDLVKHLRLNGSEYFIPKVESQPDNYLNPNYQEAKHYELY